MTESPRAQEDDPSPSTTLPRSSSDVNFEIDHLELNLFQQIGRGTYGLVQKGRWRDVDVAVKTISNEMEKRAFIVELKHLRRVKYPHIVTLYGASTRGRVCLVMELMKCGSVHDLLHSALHISYSVDHALSWIHQTADAVAYLHSLRLVHRDLKPPNLLLTDHYRLLKICDFGTVADLKTTMTNNRGSAAWMAPEVFHGTKYGAKCDVYSLGIIIHEVFSRKKPFEELGGPAFRIMWKVHEGVRPPPIAGLPQPLADLMTSCWQNDAPARPSMQQVLELMSEFIKMYPHGNRPLYDTQVNQPVITPQPSAGQLTPGQQKTFSASPVPVRQIPAPLSTPHINESLESLSSSSGIVNIFDPNESPNPPPRGHRRGGSYEAAFLNLESSNGGLPVPMIRRSSSSAMDRPMAIQTRRNAYTTNESGMYDVSANFLQVIDPKLRPEAPMPNNSDSERMYQIHMTVCKDIVEIDRVMQRKIEYKHNLIAQIAQLVEYEKLLKRRDHLQSVKKDAELRINARRRAYPPIESAVPME